jgi:membrane protease YdiL (CAAX protease family)
MLFWCKKTTIRGLIAWLLLALAAYGLSVVVGVPLAMRPSPGDVATGVALWLAILASDVAIHALLSRFGGTAYAKVGADFQSYVRGMTPAACLTGGLVAGLGEEPLFRGALLPLFATVSPLFGLLATAVLFGAAHFIRPSLGLIAAWAAWQGILLGLAYQLTGSLTAVMVAHLLHDASAFLALTRR